MYTVFVYRTQIYSLLHWYTVLPSCCCCPAPAVYRAALSPCNLYTDIHTATTIYRPARRAAVYRHQPEYTACTATPLLRHEVAYNIPTHQSIYRMFCHAPPRMPLRRSHFDSNGLLLLGYKYKGSTNKTRYSLNMAVSRLCCAWVGWGIYDILRGAGYSLHHTPHIKRGISRRLPFSRFAAPANYRQITGKLD